MGLAGQPAFAVAVQVSSEQTGLLPFELGLHARLLHLPAPVGLGVVRRFIELVALGAHGDVELLRRADFLRRQIIRAFGKASSRKRDR